MDEKIKLVEHLAALAELTFSDQEKKEFVEDMQDIIKLIDNIKEADVKEQKPKDIKVLFKNLREDEAKVSLVRDKVLENATKVEENCFVTAKVVG